MDVVTPAPFFASRALFRAADKSPVLALVASYQCAVAVTHGFMLGDDLAAVIGWIPEHGGAEVFTAHNHKINMTPHMPFILRHGRLILRKALQDGGVRCFKARVKSGRSAGARMARVVGFKPDHTMQAGCDVWRMGEW